MLRHNLAAVCLFAATILAGCAGLREPTGRYAPIPISDFVDSLKCDYANYIVNYQGSHLPLKGWPVTGTMELNVLVGEDNEASAGSIIPFTGGSLTLGASYSVSRKKTVVTTITFLLDQRVTDTSICKKIKDRGIEPGLGFGKWLWGIATQMDLAKEGAPLFGVSQLDYQLVFAVEQKFKANGGVNLTIIPLSLSGSSLAMRNDVQTIKIKMEPNEVIIGYDKKGKPIKKKNVKLFSTGQGLSPMVVSGAAQ